MYRHKTYKVTARATDIMGTSSRRGPEIGKGIGNCKAQSQIAIRRGMAHTRPLEAYAFNCHKDKVSKAPHVKDL